MFKKIKIMNFIKKLFRELFNLNVSQFLAFIFFAAPLALESLNIFFDGNQYDSNANYHWKSIILFLIILPNGLRIFLASWATEDDPMHKEITKLIREESRLKEYFEWVLRFSWLLLVYLLPFIVQTNNSVIIERGIIAYWLLLFSFLLFWDIWTKKSIKKYRSKLIAISAELAKRKSSGQIEENEYFEITETTEKVIISSSKKNFEVKVKIWFGIDVSVISCLILFYFIVFIFSYIDTVNMAVIYGIVGAIIALAFLVELILNLEDYGFRLLWCLIVTILVAFAIQKINKIPKDKVSLELLKAQLIKTDSLFAAEAMEKGINIASVEFVDNDARIFTDYDIPLDGKNIIVNYLKVHLVDDKIIWNPIIANVYSDGSFGYTSGKYMTIKNSDTTRGNYSTSWVKDKNNNWKFILNTGK